MFYSTDIVLQEYSGFNTSDAQEVCSHNLAILVVYIKYAPDPYHDRQNM